MSYPTIGMPGMVPGDKWTPEAIEKLLRDGVHIYTEDNEAASAFSSTSGKFVFQLLPPHADGGRSRWEFDTFLELAVFVAFMGKDFL